MGCCGGQCGCQNNLNQEKDAFVTLSYEKSSESSDQNEEPEVKYSKNDLIIIQFSAEWCAPCRALKASIKKDEELQSFFKKETKGYFVVDVESKDKTDQAWVAMAKPSRIPLVVIYKFDKSWKELDRFNGVKPTKEILKWLKGHKDKISA